MILTYFNRKRLEVFIFKNIGKFKILDLAKALLKILNLNLKSNLLINRMVKR